MASSTDDNAPGSTVQEVKISTDDDQSEKTGDTEFFDVAEGSPKSQLTPGLPEVAEASEADIETSSVMSNGEPSLQNNQSESEAKDDVDVTSTEGPDDDESDTESSESGSSDEEDSKSSSSDSEGSDQSGQDTEIDDTARSRDDDSTHQESLGNQKDATKKVSNLEIEQLLGKTNASALEPISTTLPIESLHADIDSMREVPISIQNMVEVVSPLNEPTEGEETTPNKDNRKELSDLERPPLQDDPIEENEVDDENSFKSSNSNEKSKEQSDDEEEESSLFDGRPKTDGVNEVRSKSSFSDDVPESVSIDAEKVAGNNNSPELEDLKALLQSNPSSIEPPATSPTEDNQEEELKNLEDILTEIKNSNPLETAPISELPTNLDDNPAITKDSAFDLPKIIRAEEGTKSPTADPHLNDEGSTEEGLSVFSNGTSGQDFLRSVSNAKRSIDEIDQEMRELKGVSAPRENKVEAKTSSDKGEKAPIEKNRDTNNVHTKVPAVKESTKEASKRRMEPSTKKEQGSSKQPSNDNKKKQRRKTTKKKQVHPEKEEHNGPIDPDGKVIPRTRYRKRGTERDTQSFSEVGNVDESPHHKDPPMVIDGHLEPDEPAVEKNDNGKADSGKRKKKKKKKKKKDVSRGDIKHDRPSEEEDAELIHSVVSSRMDRGDDESVPVDEINVDSEESDTYKSDDPHKEYDPWEEVPCSWCCRYLPHSLVVATTQAYRLDRADEKENELMIDSRH